MYRIQDLSISLVIFIVFVLSRKQDLREVSSRVAMQRPAAEMSVDRMKICVTGEHVARARRIGAPRHQRRRRANSTNGHSKTVSRALGNGWETRTEERGLLTVCRLNVLGSLLNQLTYCLCGRQPLPCLHGTFLLSFPPSLSTLTVVVMVVMMAVMVVVVYHPSIRRVLLLFHFS